jgi:hypothetical protein
LRLLRRCPWLSARDRSDRCDRHACGTASEDDPRTAWRRWFRLDQRVRPSSVTTASWARVRRAHGSRTPEPKLPTRCAGWCVSGLYQAVELGGCRSVVPSCTRSSRGVAARPVSNLVSIGGSGPVRSRTPAGLRSSATRDRSAGRARQGRCRPRPTIPCSQSQFGRCGHLRRRGRAPVECAVALSVVVRSEPVRTVVNGRLVARPVRRPSTDRRRWFPR